MEVNYGALKEHLDKQSKAFYEIVDKVVTLCSGSLALSITFRGSITGQNVSNIWLLQMTWIAFALAIITGTSYHFSKMKVHGEIAYRINKGESFGITTSGPVFGLIFKACVCSFILGTISLVAFGVVNTL